MSEDREAQDDELLALASIYDEDFQRAETAQGGEFRVCLELPPDFRLVTKGDRELEYNVCFLPPLVLNFELPADYPSSSPPVFTLSSKWMSKGQMSSLCRRLDQLWEENHGSVVLFTWVQFLKEDTLDFLGIQSPLEVIRRNVSGSAEEGRESREESTTDCRAVLLMDPRADPLPQLLDYDEAQRQRAFDCKLFCCGICFSDKQGGDCLCFKECQHVFCKACLSGYFQVQIADGNVQCLNCPEPKCTSSATPLQVKQLVGEEMFARYDRLLLQSTLDLMPDVVYCPRQSCGTAVMLEPDTTMGICSACRYAFCTICKMGYHGMSHCKASAEELSSLRDEYLSASEEQQGFMEKRFGKRVIQKAVEESSSREWLDENCKECPRCSTNIQKVDGCNKMTCTSCHQYFCWLCMVLLSRVNPYSHYNNPQSKCYNHLFLGVDMDEEEEDF
ncbi:E3 ubiquitin-protein ligase RNF14 isoform X1 [Synchiropus splendidus]|uniref:E3 ubiquitin-protein ligase RNF14 isoform X1 n=1 Tax=Synchiropus splendidus TaxID=270530 RepID=UPI00237EB42E|nr:E3 ubiquitin-protein ligase RNF14 isoform X1 [Synchiropus splendidus]XP_053704131.1 E3 ubiquitin-protein ligase RNF14 isoform X1 [Synchiropus splendidus]